MVEKFTVLEIDPTGGGYGVAQDLTILGICNLKYAQFQPVAEDKDKPSTIRIRHPADMAGIHLSEGYRWCAGWRDLSTGHFNASKEVYGGYVQKHTGSATGRLKTLTQTLTGYNCLLTRTRVVTWPNQYDMTALYPLGRSARDWLIGVAGTDGPYDGIVRHHLSAAPVDWTTGVEPVFSTVIFDEAIAPGTMIPEAPWRGRAFGFQRLNTAVGEILEAIRFSNFNLDPVAFFDAVVNPDNPMQIIPRFRLIDRNNLTATSYATYSKDPLPGEWQVEQDFAHSRDWTEVCTRMLVKSSDFELVGSTLELIQAEVFDSEFNDRYSTTWQNDPGWADVIVDESIPTIAECQALAQSQIYLRRDAEGRITFRTSHYAPVGVNITLNIPEEGQMYAVHRVTDVDAVPNIGRPLWDITVGADRPDTTSIFNRMSKKLTAVYQVQTLLRGGGGGGGGVPTGTHGNPQSRGVATNPIHSGQNVAQASSDAITLMTTKPGYLPAAIGPESSRTPNVNRIVHLDPAGKRGQWTTDADARPHPNQFPLGGFDANGTFTGFIVSFNMKITSVHIEGPGAIEVFVNGTSTGGVQTGSGIHTFSTPIALRPYVASVHNADKLTYTVTGAGPGASVTYFTLIED